MKHLTTASIPVALGAMVLASALSAQGTTTNTWFNAGISGYTSGTDVTNITGWAATPADGDASKVVEGAAIQLDTKDSVLAYTPTEGASPIGTNAIVTASIKFVAADSAPELPLPTAKACLAVSNDCYIAYSGGNWVRMHGATPDTSDYVTVRAELDFATDPSNPKVRYFVGDNALVNAAENGTDWVALATAPATLSIGKVAFSGAGNVSALSGQYYYEIASLYVVTVDGVPNKPIVLTQAWLDAHTELTTPADINTYLEQIGANGLPNWKSYVLGLESESAPIWVGTVANGDATKMTIKMNGPGATLPASGITVTYRLEKQDGSSWTAVGEDQSSPQFDLSLTSDPTGKYRVIAIFTAQ